MKLFLLFSLLTVLISSNIHLQNKHSKLRFTDNYVQIQGDSAMKPNKLAAKWSSSKTSPQHKLLNIPLDSKMVILAVWRKDMLFIHIGELNTGINDQSVGIYNGAESTFEYFYHQLFTFPEPLEAIEKYFTIMELCLQKCKVRVFLAHKDLIIGSWTVNSQKLKIMEFLIDFPKIQFTIGKENFLYDMEDNVEQAKLNSIRLFKTMDGGLNLKFVTNDGKVYNGIGLNLTPELEMIFKFTIEHLLVHWHKSSVEGGIQADRPASKMRFRRKF
jgi:hypothetical protein